MTKKSLSIVSYLTLIGWGISFYYFSKGQKNPLLQYHLKQSLGLIVLGVLLGLVIRIMAIASLGLATILSWVGILLLILLVLGAINALNETEKPVPLVGKFFENKFSFIK